MDSLVKAVQAADGPWPVLAIAIIGLYFLLYRFGKDILGLLHDQHTQTQHISDSIVTNHGSKNIGDAVDRITEQVSALRNDFNTHRTEVQNRLELLETH